MNRTHSRFYFRKSYALLVIVLFVLVMSWEQQRTDAAMVETVIPQESIRLRILANSDAPADQAVKRVVRDAIVKAMDNWVTGPQTIEEARQTVRDHMGEIESIVADVLASRGFDYSYKAELGMVPFPTKMYSNEVYPAGNYEALLVTLGEGQGQNWWCVLFPPLCFIDAATGEAAAAVEDPDAEAAQAQANAGTVKTASADKAGNKDTIKADKAADHKSETSAQQDNGKQGEAPEAKFFLWEIIQQFINWLKSLF
ncbi:stage II sporulation protein R [Paenibacillus glycanilyticus]|uniref:Stage II sporulation protein R n=1 Tax=Paenibacillus glycanilyticus TaxID=126569 RepID=A0ABQ6GGM7_9BACL|nr:stage II sporulation protein R [Paenibacillus glycanilyticus]GLX70104.1 stage II sporulation protein R [Paenibacillus glycanilyticus]